MVRTLNITRVQSFVGGGVKMGIKLDGAIIDKIGNGQSLSFHIDDRSHNLEVIALSLIGKPTLGVDPATAFIMAGSDDCTVTVSVVMGLIKNKIKAECQYHTAPVSEANFIHSVTEFMVNVFNGNAILERLEDPNNRRHDLSVSCHKDGVHIRWQLNETKNMDEWSKGYAEEIIPYEAAGVTMPKDQLTGDVLSRVEDSVKGAIVNRTRFVKNEYGAFVPGNKKSSLY